MAYGLGYAGGYSDSATDPLSRILEIEFDADVWTDVTEHAIQVSTRRGRNKESGSFETGTMVFTLRNDDRLYDPDNADGDYYEKLRPNRRARFRAYRTLELPVFQGYIDRITQNWGGPNDATATFECSDMFKLLNRVELPGSPYAAELAEDSPGLWWRLGEPAGATTAVDASGNGRDGAVNGPVTFGESGLTVHDPDSAVSMDETAYTYIGPGAITLNHSTPWAIEFWFRMPANPTMIQYVVWAADGNPDTISANYMNVQVNNVTRYMHVLLGNSAGTTYTALGSVALNADQTYHVVVTHNADRVLRTYIDGALYVSGDTTAGTFSMTGFYVGSPTGTAAPNAIVDEVAVYNSGASPAITTSRIGDHNTVGRTAWVGDTSGARLTKIADLAAIPSGDRDIDAGSTTLQATDLGGTALSYAQKVEETEAGRLFISADGDLTFISRANAETGSYLTPQATLVDADSGAGIGYRTASAEVDEATLITRATVSREGSNAVTYQDNAAIAEFGILDEVHDGLLHDDDAYSMSYAQWLVNTHNVPKTRLGTITVELAVNPDTNILNILGLELGDRVTWKRTPQNTGDTIVEDMRVEAIAHDTAGKTWSASLQLSPFYLTGEQTGVWDTSLWDQAAWGL